MTTITLDNVFKYFNQPGGKRMAAVDNVSLNIPSGDVLAILGPSGCGKTTLLRLIAGTEKPDRGRVLYDRVDLKAIDLMDRGIGMVFQEHALIPHWETGKSVGLFLSLRHREHELPERVLQVSKITGIGLEKLLDRRPAQLSGGEQQRVAIARALARDMRVLLFDEPFANLDAKLRAEARVELKRLLNEFPTTAIYVTHDQHEAAALSHRIAVMRAGKIEQSGTYQQLYSSPVNRFVAEFIGTPNINMFNGQVRDGKWWGETFGGYPVRSDLEDGAQVTVGIRPEYMNLDSEGVPGVVDAVTPFFAERYQLIEVWLGSDRWSLKTPLQEQIEVGSTIYSVLDPEEILYFNTYTGQRIG
jgi:multiple sugar transport system ATP-binding protein